MVATFGAYFCMYGLRKPFTAASYSDVQAWGQAYKPLAIAAQVLGYMASKFIGIKVIAELNPARRVMLLLGLVAVAQAALVAFSVTPAPWNLGWLLVNGLPLGMVFGIVLGFLEGRRHTEALAAGLCTSFIVADGVAKSVGQNLLDRGVPQFAMPAVAGLIFIIPLLGFAWMLTRIPPPSLADVAARSARSPMNRAERQAFFRRYGLGLTLITVMYLFITILRSVRADFAPEIWAGLGVEPQAGLYAWTELVVAAGVLVLNGLAVTISDNRRAFFFAVALSVVGAATVLSSLAAYRAGLSPFAFMVLQGLGLYLPYIAVHTTIFERLIAMTRDRGNIGYLMYLADAFGYLGYVAVLVVRNWTTAAGEFLPFYQRLSGVIAAGCVLIMLPCWKYFANLGVARAAGELDPAASAPAGVEELVAVEP
ncbi:MAG: hypothetical protein DCC67_00900 [Planctomycetota bacterium]|nr:MAG: hypothetical protein DCC67_00900 [Planctomycetota bacterium]